MIRVRIEELVLHGFDPRDRRAIGDAVRDELGRLLATQALTASTHNFVDAGEVPVDSIRSRTTGASVAGAVHRGITGGGEAK